MNGESETIAIQSMKVQNARVANQFWDLELNTALYLGKHSEERWKEWHHLHPMRETPSIPLDAGVTREFDVIDLGPGSGDPCIAAITAHRNRVQEVICIDASLDMANLAADAIVEATGKPVVRVIADFLRDTKEIQDRVLSRSTRSKVLLCLGGTVGNYRQSFVLPKLRELLTHEQDRLVLGMGHLTEQDPNGQLRDLGEKFCSEQNCRFALSCLEEYGHHSNWQDTHYTVADDGEEPDIKVVHGYYRFPEAAGFVVEDDPKDPLTVSFQGGDELEFTQSRRYPKALIPNLLAKYRLELLEHVDMATHGLYLCKKKNGNGNRQ